MSGATPAESAPAAPLLDLLITPVGGGHGLTRPLTYGFLRNLIARGYLDQDPAPLPESGPWRFLPGASADRWFGPPSAPGEPVFQAAWFWAGHEAAPLPFGDGQAWFWMWLRGTRLEALTAVARREWSERFHVEARFIRRPFVPDAAPPEDARLNPAPKADRSGSEAPVGVRIEEF